jgi:hypothetical protein
MRSAKYDDGNSKFSACGIARVSLCYMKYLFLFIHVFVLPGVSICHAIQSDHVLIQRSATNASPAFKKFLYSYPLQDDTSLKSIVGSASINTDAQGFAQALIIVFDIPRGNPCPVNGENYTSYDPIHSKYPSMIRLASFIIKEPKGQKDSTIKVDLHFPQSIPVSGCVGVILDGSVRKIGGQFLMSSQFDLVLDRSALSRNIKPIDLGDEFCFGIKVGCQRAAENSDDNTSFIRVLPIKEPMTVLAVYGDVSDGSFGDKSGVTGVSWKSTNTYYAIRNCHLRDGDGGPFEHDEFLENGFIEIFDVKINGAGHKALQKVVYKGVSNISLAPGDCLVHSVKVASAPEIGGVDAESQVFLLVRTDSQ